MIKIVTIVGARPQFIKAAAISRAIRNDFGTDIKEIIVHTGQHYDPNMSKVFFEELNIPQEDYNLEAGSDSHANQTAKIMEGIEKILMKETPDCLLLYGDTNSTLAGGVVASKLHIPIVHVEAGVRSYNKHYPEEVNRIVCDHLSTLLFTPTTSGVNNLAKEGFNLENKAPYTVNNPKVFFCGDIMYDNSLHFAEVAKEKSLILSKLGIKGKEYVLVTVHRPHNTDDLLALNTLFRTFNELSKQDKISFIIPLHPRTQKAMEKGLDSGLYHEISNNPFIQIIPPASFLDIIQLESNAKLIMTDSGGVQKEAYFFHKPCIIFQEDTAWVELVESGNARVVGSDETKIKEAYQYYMEKGGTLQFAQMYGDGNAAKFICQQIVDNFKK
ncbi:MAG: UDP-N-acetylglucosamine 2-epimerase (non-hydrolyzing) [Bacteroidota bacterium]